MKGQPRWAVWVDWLALIGLGLVIALPRLLALDRFVTADEPKWLARSGNFYLALSKGDWANTFTREHPGVTITWLGMFGYLWRYPTYVEDAPGRLTDSTQVEPVMRLNGKQPMEVLWAGRTWVVLAITLTLLAAYWVTCKLIGRLSAWVAFCLIALDPFFLGLSRLLHLDGLLSSLMLLAMVLFLLSLHNQNRKWRFLVLSGAVSGLAWLTKSPALFLAPFFGLLVCIDLLHSWLEERKWNRARIGHHLGALAAWGAAASLVFVALFPAMWVTPLEVLRRIFAEAETYAAEGHSTVIFFNGAIVMGDPGRRFYLVNYLWRTTPVGLLGLVFTLPAFLPRVRGWMSQEERRLSLTLLLFSALFGAMLTLGAKKFDRYLLPLFPALDLVAALGWVAAARWLWQHRSRVRRYLGVALLASILIAQAIFALTTFPYYLSYYNPWMGGAQKAPQSMMIGWGEGLDQAARYLNQLPNASNLRVLSWYPDGCFSYLFQGQALGTPPEWEETRERLKQVDYAVLYINQWQRNLPFPQMLCYFEKQKPEFVVRINGIEYAQVYNLKNAPPPE